MKRLLLVFLVILAGKTLANTYYFHPDLGNNQNAGTSNLLPFKSLDKINSLALKPGDTLLLAAGYTFPGSLILNKVRGSEEKPVVIASYTWGNALEDPRAVIDAKGYANGVYLSDCSHVFVKDLIIRGNGGGLPEGQQNQNGMRCGVLVITTQPGDYTGIELNNLLVEDIFFEEAGFVRGQDEVRTANGSQSYGWGIRFINQTEGALLKDLTVQSCTVQNVAHTGIKFTARDQSIQHIKVYKNRVLQTGGPGVQMSGVLQGHVKNNYINQSGSNDDSRKWGRGSGLWTWGTSDVVIENNHFLNANGPGDSAGCHIDFNCTNVVVQYNFSAQNAGGFCEILGNNYNCAYRYNISVNDGHRVKGENGAFQEGKTFWLSGYQGNKKPRKGPFNSYLYNNTIFVSKDIVSKIAVDRASEGVLIVNNIFVMEGESKLVLGDQYKPEEAGESQVKNVVFQNNLYLRPDNWPKDVFIQDSKVKIGDPEFFAKGGMKITDYIPTNRMLIKDQGIEISCIPGDTIGLTIGLQASHDILGNKISGKPDLGAIEINGEGVW